MRIFRTARRMGMRTVAVYSDADVGAPHARAADDAVHIGPAPAADSYLRRDRIVEAARSAGADLVHPGYGFLAEDDRFAQECAEAGLIFVGPPASVLREVGDKAAA
ncbi:MAG: biotin carboxylase N-terminal domain-containing protein, partial [Actinomycetota bacterium]